MKSPTIFLIYFIIIYVVTTPVAENVSTMTSASEIQTNSFTDMEIDSADCIEQYCYDMDFEKKQYNQLGTKTPYRRKSVEINRQIPSKTSFVIYMYLT